jgi:hypothetical protein
MVSRRIRDCLEVGDRRPCDESVLGVYGSHCMQDGVWGILVVKS